jgi:hypothetical protein
MGMERGGGEKIDFRRLRVELTSLLNSMSSTHFNIHLFVVDGPQVAEAMDDTAPPPLTGSFSCSEKTLS